MFVYSNFIPCEYPSCHPASHSAIFIGLTIGEQSIILLDDELSIASPAAIPFWNPSSYAWSSAMTIFVGISNIKESINKIFISKLRWNRRLLYCVPVVIFGAFWHICSKLNLSTMDTRWKELYVTFISHVFCCWGDTIKAVVNFVTLSQSALIGLTSATFLWWYFCLVNKYGYIWFL